MALGKNMRLLLILLDITLIVYTIVHMVYKLSPINQPVYWICGAIEIGLALLTYRFWMRSRTSTGLSKDRIIVLVLIIIAIAVPNIVDRIDIEFLKPASSTDLFFFCSALTLLIYSSYKIKPPEKVRKSK